MKHTSRWIALAVSLFCFNAPSKSQTASPSPANPSPDWQTIRPEDAGYSSARLEAIRSWLKTGQTSAMIVVVHGKIIFQYGDLSHASKIASIRKSICSPQYWSRMFVELLASENTRIQLERCRLQISWIRK